MAVVRNVCLGFGLKAITNKLFDLGVWNYARTQNINIPIHFV